MDCPCGFGEPYEACCARAHTGQQLPPTAESLMRARYSAYAIGDRDYLLNSWHSSTRPAQLMLPEQLRWTRLQILDRGAGGLFDQAGTVEFVAHYREDGRSGQQRENSRFVREDGQWRYLGPQAVPS
ncbi:MAG: YchJ family metal-binding protein [Jatrophihabitantaceae bacterium]